MTEYPSHNGENTRRGDRFFARSLLPEDVVPTADHRDKNRRVAIIGAGVSGLCAAIELERMGFTVSVFEATSYPGGRIHTWRTADGLHGELGARRIPRHHQLVLDYLRRFGVAIRNLPAQNNAAWSVVNEIRTRATEDDASSCFVEATIEGVLEDLTDADIFELLDGPIQSDALVRLDQKSFPELFQKHLSDADYTRRMHVTGAHHYRNVSAASGIVDWINWGCDEVVEAVDGLDELTRKMAESLDSGVRYREAVVEISCTDDGVDVVSTRSHARTAKNRFEFAVCCVPTHALKDIRVDPPFSAERNSAISELKYSPAAKTLMVTNRFWEDEGIFGGCSVTDLNIHQCCYPNDNTTIDNNRWMRRDRARSLTPGVLVAGYRWEGHARRFAHLSQAQRDEQTVSDLQVLHPRHRPQIVETFHQMWPHAYAFFGPGERTRVLSALRKPHPQPIPRVFFAGEHLSASQGSVQGALEAAHRAIAQLHEHASLTKGKRYGCNSKTTQLA